jgi:hypothetical protein
MFHLGVFTKTSVGNITDEDIPAVNDQVLTISNNHFIPPVPMKILILAAGAVNGIRFKIQTPKLRAMVVPQYGRLALGALPNTRANIVDHTPMPLAINPIDELSCLFTTNVVAATQPTCGVWLDDGHTQRPRGEPYWIHGTASITGVANAWQNGAITLDQTLPAGRYSVVGMRCVVATNTLFARLIFPTQVFRPGVPVAVSFGADESNYFENGYLGEFGQFASIAQPLLEIFSNTAGAVTPDVFLQLLKLS